MFRTIRGRLVELAPRSVVAFVENRVSAMSLREEVTSSSFEHDYGDVESSELRDLLPKVCDVDASIGVFRELEEQLVDGVWLYSFPRLVESSAQRLSYVRGLTVMARAGLVSAVDRGIIAVPPGVSYGAFRLAAALVELSRWDGRGVPGVAVYW